MRRFVTTIVLALSTFLLPSFASAQQAASNSVPNLIRYSGTLKDAQGAPLSSSTAMGVTFAIYKQQEGGAAVWQETQNVTPDSSGQYNVLLGSTTATGLPDDLFSQQEQRWLGVQVQGQEEQARVLLVSVPYAFKAHEAETLGGMPASAFAKAATPEGDGPPADATAVNALSSAASRTPPRVGHKASVAPCGPVISTSGGITNSIPVWAAPCDLTNSIISQTGIPPSAAINVNGSINLLATGFTYNINGSPVLAVDNFVNTKVGWRAGLLNTGVDNTIVGGLTGLRNSGNYNTIIGFIAGHNNSGDNNTFAGFGAGENNAANDNSFVGYKAGQLNNSGAQNTFLGSLAGPNNQTGGANTFVGRGAGYTHVKGDQDTFVGTSAGFNDQKGTQNTYIGASAGQSNVSGAGVTAVGVGAGLFYIAGTNNTFLGTNAGVGVNGQSNGSYNTFLGSQAGNNNTTGSNNTFSGYQAGFSNGADGNSYYGYQTGFHNSAGGNSFFGYQAGYTATSSTANTFVGDQAGFNSTTDDTNDTPSENTFVGYEAGLKNTVSHDNAFFGAAAGLLLATGNNNVFVGWGAGSNNTSGSSNIYLGHQGCSFPCTEQHTIRIGMKGVNAAQQNKVFIDPINSNTSTSNSANVFINTATGQLGVFISSVRFKEHIGEMGDGSSGLFQLRPVTFLYRPEYDDGSRQVQYGLIAEEVAKIYPEMVAYDKEGQPYTVKYQMLAPMLLNELQKEHKVVMAQQAQLETQFQQIKGQREEIESLKLELRLQNAAMQERLTKVESYVATQMKTASEVSTATSPSANGDRQ